MQNFKKIDLVEMDQSSITKLYLPLKFFIRRWVRKKIKRRKYSNIDNFSLLITRIDKIIYCHLKYVCMQNFKKIGSVEVGQNSII